MFFYLKKRKYNSCLFYIFLKAGFFKSKTYFLYIQFIVIRTLMFFKYILVSTTITNYKYNKNKKNIKQKLI